jgi:hypothetical protein
MAEAVIYSNTFTFPAGGTTSQTDPLPLLDLSRVSALRFLFRITKADTDAGDTLEIRFQEKQDGTLDLWDTRLRSPTFLGTLSPSATAPEDYVMVLPCKQAMTAAETSFEPFTSAGAAEMAANSVRGGPLLGKYRPTNGMEPRHRLLLNVVDAGGVGDAAFTVTVNIASFQVSDFP